MSRYGDVRGGRWVSFAGVASVLGVVCDGWSGKPSLLVHQILLIPFSLALGIFVWGVLRSGATDTAGPWPLGRRTSWRLWLLASFEAFAVSLMAAEARHFQRFGYHVSGRALASSAAVIAVGWFAYWRQRKAAGLFSAVLVTYVAGVGLAIADFPLNYLRSDMLPVIEWADQRLLLHLNPYGTMHVGTRTYDFPYLPGMLVAYWPAVALHLDPRMVSLAYLLAGTGLIWWCARPEQGLQVAASIGVFLLCPFLQYRHELYLQPHWFLLVVAVVLMQRGRIIWAAMVWGLSCAVYQFSWVLLPFVLLYANRRGRLVEAGKVASAAVVGALLLAGPFVRSAWQQIKSNTVGQWSRLPHALADPMNVSYWLTYLVRPAQLKWIQAIVLVGIFGYCWFRKRCDTLADTLRWQCVALAVFIPMNVLVDGYFYLTLLLMLLLFVCVANGWWREMDGVDGRGAASVSTGG